MKISWNWLQRHVDLSGLDPREIANRFTMSVAELEGIEEFGASYHQVVAARIDSATPHPDSDKLQVLGLSTGTGTVTVVSGAPNCTPGAIVPFAPPGTRLEGVEGKPVVQVVSLRGIDSPGVVCSESELGLSDDHSGLLHFPSDTVVGTPLTQLLQVHDFILEIDNKSITHRPDLWGHRGLAREVAALVNRPMKPFAITIPEGSQDPLKVSVECPDLCPRYTALKFDGVVVRPSPLWMKLALSTVGVRPISNIVDITNFVMLDVGNPTHAFDARTLAGNTICVRRATPGETLVTLDGEPRQLLADDTVIADGERGVALAGVMGGLNSEIEPDTSSVVLESACFNASAVRRTSARLGLRTEASARFEKGLDHLSPLQAVSEFARLIRELSPECSVSSRFYDVAAPEPTPTVIHVSADFIRRKLGVAIDNEWMKEMLSRIDFRIADQEGNFAITVPTYRATKDIRIPVDIVEEIGRLWGYDNIPDSPILAEVKPQPSVPTKELQHQARMRMVEMAYQEVMTYSFDSATQARLFGMDLSGALELANPISADLPVLRRSLIPNLLAAVARNAYHTDDFRLFEVGRVFFPSDKPGDIPIQFRHLGACVVERRGENLAVLLRAKGHVQAMLTGLSRGKVTMDIPTHHAWENQPWLIPDKTLEIRVAGTPVGQVSLLSPVLRDRLKLKGRVALFEVNLDTVLALPKETRLFVSLPRFPAVEKDLSVIVDETIPYARVESAIRGAASELLQELSLFATFRGAPIPEGRKSLSFHLGFRHPERTLKDEDVSPVLEAILAALAENVRGEIRT